MSTTTDLIDRYYAALARADWAAYDDLVAPDATFAFSGGVDVTGPDGMRMFDRVWKDACPDFVLEARQPIDTGDRVAVVCHYSGTHTEVLHLPEGDIPPTGKHIEGDGVSLFEVAGGQITSQRVYVDRLDLMQQLGLLPEPAAAGA